MFSRVSEWVLSDRREDRIDDFVQEMEINGFWLLARRECVASMLLKNVDYKNTFHCDMVCSSEEELVKHRSGCKFRPMDCTNEGCSTRYCAAQKEHHEAVCPFMILPCEQKCSDYVMRREMDRHCVTICPMKLVNCAFYTVGCKSSIPRCNVQQHNVDELSSHLLYIIRSAHKEAAEGDLKHRVEQICELSNIEKLTRARDARALTFLIKDAESKLGPLEVNTKPNASESVELPTREESNKTESPTKTVPTVVNDGSDSPNKNETRSSTEKTAIPEDTKLPIKEVQPESANADSPVKTEEGKDKEEPSPLPKEEHTESPFKKEISKNLQEDESKGIEAKETVKSGSPIKETAREVSVSDQVESTKSPPKEEKSKPLSSSNEEDTNKSPKEESVSNEKELKKSLEKEKIDASLQQRVKTHDSSSDEEEMMSPSEIYHDS